MSRMNSHPHPAELSAYLDGDVEAPARGRIADHLEACPECREVVGELRGLTERLAAHPDPAPPRDLWPDLVARIRREGALPTADAGRRARWWARPVWLAPAAGLAALLVVVVGLRLLGPGAPSDSTGSGGEEVAAGAPAAAAPAAEGSVALYREAAEAMKERVAETPLPEGLAAVVEEDLATYDRAVAQTTAALERSPDDPELRAHLLRTLEAQVRYLRRLDDSVTTLL